MMFIFLSLTSQLPEVVLTRRFFSEQKIFEFFILRHIGLSLIA